jgi:hypothetical protein
MQLHPLKSKTPIAVAALCLAGCAAEPKAPPADSVTPTAAGQDDGRTAVTTTFRLAWGSGPGEVALRPAAADSLAQGPSAAALMPDGTALIVDRFNHRILRAGASGVSTLAPIAEDTEAITCGPDGAVALYSPLRAHVWVLDPSGRPAGEMAVPRIVRDIESVELGASRRLTVGTAFQETYSLGSPSLPLPLPAVLASKQEGLYALSGGLRAAVRRRGEADPVLELVIVDPRSEAARPPRVHVVGDRGQADAARVIGAEGRTVCLKLESVTQRGEALDVTRRVVCVDAVSGQIGFSRLLPARGVYVPRQEVSLSAGQLLFLHPEAGALRLERYAILPGGPR